MPRETQCVIYGCSVIDTVFWTGHRVSDRFEIQFMEILELHTQWALWNCLWIKRRSRYGWVNRVSTVDLRQSEENIFNHTIIRPRRGREVYSGKQSSTGKSDCMLKKWHGSISTSPWSTTDCLSVSSFDGTSRRRPSFLERKCVPSSSSVGPCGGRTSSPCKCFGLHLGLYILFLP